MKMVKFLVTATAPLNVVGGRVITVGELMAVVYLPEGIDPKTLADYYYNGQVRHEIEESDPAQVAAELMADEPANTVALTPAEVVNVQRELSETEAAIVKAAAAPVMLDVLAGDTPEDPRVTGDVPAVGEASSSAETVAPVVPPVAETPPSSPVVADAAPAVTPPTPVVDATPTSDTPPATVAPGTAATSDVPASSSPAPSEPVVTDVAPAPAAAADPETPPAKVEKPAKTPKPAKSVMPPAPL